LLALGGVVWLVWPGNELHLRTPARWRHRRTGPRQPEVLKNGLDRAAFVERSYKSATQRIVLLISTERLSGAWLATAASSALSELKSAATTEVG